MLIVDDANVAGTVIMEDRRARGEGITRPRAGETVIGHAARFAAGIARHRPSFRRRSGSGVAERDAFARFDVLAAERP